MGLVCDETRDTTDEYIVSDGGKREGKRDDDEDIMIIRAIQ